MPSIREVQHKLQDFDRAARRTESPDAFKSLWKRIFKQDLSDVAAKSFAHYYKEMRSKSKKHGGARRRRTLRQRGGAAYTLPSTPVNYTMTPGLYTQTYGSFPVEVDTDPASIRDLDVYFQDSLRTSPAGYWPQVPANMGSNKVGGGRRRKTQRRRGQRGGNLLDSLKMTPLLPTISTPYPNAIQSVNNMWSGGTTPVPAPASAVQYTWSLQGNGGAPINPGLVTNIDSSFQRLASPAPWQTSS